MRKTALLLGVAATLAAATAPSASASVVPKARKITAVVSTPPETRVAAPVALNLKHTYVPIGDHLFAYVVTYGDGSPRVVGRGTPRSLNHRYRKPGVFIITVTLTDTQHHTSTARTRVRIVAASTAHPVTPVAPATLPATPAPPAVGAPVQTAPVQTPGPTLSSAPVPTSSSPTATPSSSTPSSSDPSTSSSPTSSSNPSSSSNPPVAHPAVALAGGGDFGCALVSGGTVDCWGDNSDGQLGDGTKTERDSPTAVLTSVGGAPLTGVTAIAAGAGHTCAVLTDTSVDCWGYNSSGQLGDGTQNNHANPNPVPGLTHVKSIVADRYSTCALITDGTVSCWGDNEEGQLGDGYDNSDYDEANTPNVSVTYSPRTVKNLTTATSLAAGYNHVCAVLSDQTLDCWGNNGNGQLGLGTTTPEYKTPQPVPSLSGVTAVAAGGSHTCALLATSKMACWGDNSHGDLGDGGPANETSPSVLAMQGVTAISAGGAESCALLSTRVVYCWGDDQNGELGDGDSTYADKPTPVGVNLNGVTGVSEAEYEQTCAVLTDGSVDCWGYDGLGELGHGDPLANEDVPTPTVPLP